MSETKESLLDKLSSKMAKIMLSTEDKPKEVKLEIAKLEDGTEVEIEGDDISVLVKQEGEEVEKVPAPVGEHTLEDGSVVVVKEEGKIDEVKPKAETEEVEAKDEKEMDLASEVETLKKEVAELKEAMKPKKEEMAKEEVEPKKEELLEVEPKKEELSKVTHSPEKNVKSKVKVKLKSNGGIKSRVYSKLFS